MKARRRALAVDAIAVAAVSAGIVLASERLVFMTLLVPLTVLARFVAWRRVTGAQGREVAAEVVFFALCTVLGGFNDWMSVVHHRVYDYTVPVFFPHLSTIPCWMLLFWGLVLRSVASLAEAWPEPRPPGSAAKLAVQLLFVVVTRQLVYRHYADPWLSWLPFAAAIVLYVALFGLSARERRLGLVFLVAGPAVEALYIHAGGLHRYHLGWLAGVPLWIALWWVLAVWIWSDVSARLRRLLAAGHTSCDSPSSDHTTL